jgi:hypothetical protein
MEDPENPAATPVDVDAPTADVIDMPGPEIGDLGPSARWGSAQERDDFNAEYERRKAAGESLEGMDLPHIIVSGGEK